MKIDTVELCNKKRAGSLTNNDFYDLCDAYDEKVRECEGLKLEVKRQREVLDRGLMTKITIDTPENYEIKEYGYYPQWICSDCGNKLGSIRFSVSTFHNGSPDRPEDSCGWCRSKNSLTQPRDFGYPKYKK